MSIKLKLDGFEQLLKDIEKASGNVDKAAESAMKASAVIMQREIKDQMRGAGIDTGLINRMPNFTVENDFGKITARVGYPKGAYNPADLSDGYKAMFLEYGTPRRSEHGQEKARGYLKRAKKVAKPKIKQKQKEALNKILERLKKR